MKIILSRKGFDSAYGGYPSPILPNGSLISLPIPLPDLTRYSDLNIDKNRTYYSLMKELNEKIRYNGCWHELTENTECHLDPDIRARVVQRSKNWMPAFGQVGHSQSHLKNEGVKEGDLFLFFGWFKKTTINKGRAQFDKLAPELHVIFGYLQIGEIIHTQDNPIFPSWMQNHPHIKNEVRRKIFTNTIYVARKKSTWDEDVAGAGTFRFSNGLILTKNGLSRSKWNLPDFFKKANISRHSEKSWKEGYFKSADIGQEFVIADNDEVENWAQLLVNTNVLNH